MNRREFLVGTFLAPFIKPQPDSNSPKFKMGDCVRGEFETNDSLEPLVWYEGTIEGIVVAKYFPESDYGEGWIYVVNVVRTNTYYMGGSEWFHEEDLILA